jgi:hypothetical protein
MRSDFFNRFLPPLPASQTKIQPRSRRWSPFFPVDHGQEPQFRAVKQSFSFRVLGCEASCEGALVDNPHTDTGIN